MAEVDATLLFVALPDVTSWRGRVRLSESPRAQRASESFRVVNGRTESSDAHVG